MTPALAKTRKLLIVSPRFPPKNAPDLHRVRTSLQYYRRFGWEPTVLCLTADSSDGVDDAVLAESVPKDIEIVRVAAWNERKCRRFGFGHVDYRSWPLFRAGRKLLARGRHEIVFFSTTVFPSFLMGPPWKTSFGCKLVYDFQDPWYQSGPCPYTKSTVPGSWWKYRLAQSMTHSFEKHSLKSADHVIAVSGGYVKDLSIRYPWLNPDQFTVLPFGAEAKDFDIAERCAVENGLSRREKNTIRWVYAGRGGPDMVPTLTVFFEQLRVLRVKAPEFAARLRVHFVGTNYAPANRTYKVVEPLAIRQGVGDLVVEHPVRIPYHQTLSLYSECDAILLIGSNSADYTASKFFNCVAAKKPVLAMFHRDSLVAQIAQSFPNVALASFGADLSALEFSNAVARGMEWLQNPKFDSENIERQLAPWSAEELTRVQCAIFSRIADR